MMRVMTKPVRVHCAATIQLTVIKIYTFVHLLWSEGRGQFAPKTEYVKMHAYYDTYPVSLNSVYVQIGTFLANDNRDLAQITESMGLGE